MAGCSVPVASMQELLPRLRARRMAEQGVVVASAQPIVPGTDVNPPTGGQLVGRSQLGQDDRIVRHRGADDPVSAVDKQGHQVLQAPSVDHHARHESHRAPFDISMQA